jgi:hypothetical protein
MNLLFTPEMNTSSFKLHASNPGQFYYNIFSSSGGTSVSITLPYPWVTQGAMPIHVYDSVTVTTVNGHTCFVPGSELANNPVQVTANNDSPQAFGSTTTLNLTGLPGGWMYINIHLDYALKGTTGWSKGSSAVNSELGLTIPEVQSYSFSDSTDGNSVIQSKNIFKKDLGIGGLILQNDTGNPVLNVQVKIYQGTTLKATVFTDPDGWYTWQYKYTGKAATFTVKLPAYNLSQTVTLKSNGFLVVNFAVP